MGKVTGFLKRLKEGIKRVGKTGAKIIASSIFDPVASGLDVMTFGKSTDLFKKIAELGKQGDEKYKLEKGPKGWFLRVGSKVLQFGNTLSNNSMAMNRKMIKMLRENKNNKVHNEKDTKKFEKIDTNKQNDFDK